VAGFAGHDKDEEDRDRDDNEKENFSIFHNSSPNLVKVPEAAAYK
jgi:hypothetical protein